MTRETQKDLQVVLTEMFASKEELSLRDVQDWQGKYPEYRREIAEAYADWRDFEFFVLADEEAAIIDEEISEAGRKTVENALAQFRSPPGETIVNLRETAEKKGVSRDVLKSALGFSETLFRKLERRNLSDIPAWVEETLSSLLQVSKTSLEAFFALPSQLPQAARYKSKNVPQTQGKQPFIIAVKTDPQLKEDGKYALLNR